MRICQVIEELVEERSLDPVILSDIICEGLLAAYQKRYPTTTIKVIHDKKQDEIHVLVEKTIVSAVQDEQKEISLRKARSIKDDAVAGEIIWVPFEGSIGRIEILRAKQIIAQRLRQIESAAVFNEFKSKEGTLIIGTVHKTERNGVTVKVGDTLAFLPHSLMVPGDKCAVGYTIRALLKEVLPEPRNDNQLILDRSSKDFLIRLFELEIPEIYEKIVEITKMARTAGYKSKIVVVSHDKNIDPVGTCIGFGGARIKPVLRELGTEKIDVIAHTDSLETLVAQALKPAEINRVDIVNGTEAHVWLNADQRSLAIGKMGQNIKLASELTGLSINLVPNEPADQEQQAPKKDETLDWEL